MGRELVDVVTNSTQTMPTCHALVSFWKAACSQSEQILVSDLAQYIGHLTEVHDYYTVEPLNKGHVGDNINSLVLSFVERLSSSWRL